MIRTHPILAAEELGSGGATKEPAAPTVQVFVRIPLSDAAFEDFMQVMRNNVSASRNEVGNISFDLFLDEEGSSTVYLVERWRDQAAFDEHMETDHLKAVANAVTTAGEGESTLIWLEEVEGMPPVINEDRSLAPRNIVVIFDTSESTRAAFLNAIAPVIPAARAAPGNLGFDIFNIRDESNRFVVVEHWAQASDHEAHLQADYCQRFAQEINGLLSADPMKNRWLLKEVEVNH